MKKSQFYITVGQKNRIYILKNELSKSFFLLLNHNEHYDHHAHQIMVTN
jgi:hypothetical protein